MQKQLKPAAGYLLIFLAPALLVAATRFDEPFLALGAVLLFFPLARVLFGAQQEGTVPEWDERLAAALEALPTIYAAALAGAIGML